MPDTVFEVSLIQNPIFEVVLNQTGPAGQGVPPGGAPGDTLSKIDGTDFNTEWAPPGAVDVEAYLNALPSYISNEAAILDGLSPGDWYRTAPGHFEAPAGMPIQVQ